MIKTVVLACSKFKAGLERRKIRALRNQMPRFGFSIGCPLPSRRIEIEDFGEDFDDDSQINRPLDVSLEIEDGGTNLPFHAEPDIIIPKVAASLKDIERSPTYYELVKLTSTQ